MGAANLGVHRHMLKPALLALALGLAVNQTPTEPAPYPDGQFCSTVGTIDARGRVLAPDHKCTCRRMASPTPTDPLCEFGEGPTREDPKCLQWCSKDHCRCPLACDVATHPTRTP